MRLLIACFCGVLAALAVFWYISDIRAEATGARQQAIAKYGGEQIEVYVADRDINAGEELSPSNVSKRLWLVDLLPAGALGTEADVYGQTLAMPMLANEVVASAKLGEAGSAAEMLKIPEGLCALSVPSDNLRAVGGAIQAGTKVALYAAGSGEVRLLDTDVLVLATSNTVLTGSLAAGQAANGLSGNSSGVLGGTSSQANLKWVTLALQEERVQEVIAASEEQSLYLVLVGDDEGEKQ
ncbi:MAG: Flp pilus assembly protein CpaB [Coriobacteriia bacterium]|nr:Flp pilus assembly protein CpaB [Coriobacteriia bacterium]